MSFCVTCFHGEGEHEMSGTKRCMIKRCPCLAYNPDTLPTTPRVAESVESLTVSYAKQSNRLFVEGDFKARMTACFKLGVSDYVTVSLLALNYKGRILECTVSRAGHKFLVQYADDAGKLVEGYFYEDELKLAPA